MELMGVICLPKAEVWCGRGCREEEEREHVLCPGMDSWALPDQSALQKSSPTLLVSPSPLSQVLPLQSLASLLFRLSNCYLKQVCVDIFKINSLGPLSFP